MKKIIFRSCHCLLSLIPLSLVASHVNCANIYAFVNDEGKLFVSEKKNNAHYVKFEPKKVVSPNISSRTSPRITLHQTTWVANQLKFQFTSQMASEQREKWIMPINNKAFHYTPLINEIAEETGVNANLLHAIIQVESAYNPLATSSKGAQGLMQLIPATAERFGVEQSYNPESNVRGGARYIKNLLGRFNNDLQLALAAYNAGEGSVQKYNNTVPPYPETQAYVSKVLHLFKQREQ